MRLPQIGEEGQRRLAAARIAVVGAGGLGSPVIEYLAAAGVGRLTILDPDVLEPSNLHRQVVHSAADLGRPKAVSAAERARALAPGVEAVPVQRAVDAASAVELLAGHDVIVDGSDNFPTRYAVSDAAEILDLPVVWGSILGFDGQVAVFWSDAGRGATYRDLVASPPAPGEVPSCAEAGVVGPLCGLIGSAMALQVIHLVLGSGDPLLGRLAVLDALTLTWDQVPLQRRPGRPVVTTVEDVALTCGLPGAPTAADGPAPVEPQELPGLIADGTLVVDVREETEWQQRHLPGTRHLPLAQLLASGGPELEGAVLLCASGRRSETARRALAERGITTRSVRGGLEAVPEG
ncbi:ThiF family adenylyltransferase [Brachybacterium sp. EF45031]|nr:ThiF family adenylyltransferase [Brachybacterium sillae]